MANWIPSLNALRAFESVSRHLSYQYAARELNVTPAAVKQLVSKLETSVGGKLIRRNGRTLELTKRGNAATEDLSAAMAYIALSVRKMRTEKRETRLIVSVESSFATAWLVPKLEQFRKVNPSITVLVDSSQKIVDLDRDEVDIAIRYGVNSKEDWISHRLFNDLVFPVCSPTLAAGPPSVQSLADLAAIPLIHWNMSQLEWAHEAKRWFTWTNWLRHVGANDLITEKGLHFSDYGLAVQSAIAGQGMVLASWPILREPIDAGLLIAPFLEVVSTDIGYDVVTTAYQQTRPEAVSFIDWLVETANQEISFRVM